ncbi:MAG: ribonuclease P protein component [Bacteroidales bacterium]|jgi:ribonuclease P protein component|nr:ribonuclease P protein component [Bacteroidales bacterium]
MIRQKASLVKGERLCGVKAISELFAGGRFLSVPPLKIIYRTMPSEKSVSTIRVLISVPKRHFRKATDRNLIRRRIREAWRLNRRPLAERLEEGGRRMDLAIIWNDIQIRPYDYVLKSVTGMIGRLTNLKY